MTPEIFLWAQRWGVDVRAIHELTAMILPPAKPTTSTGSEARTQSEVRLEAHDAGVRLWRNNVGVLTNEHGTPVRYGLGNDSKAVNARLKSGDLIGWRPVTITPSHVGVTIAQFVSRECKPAGWTYSGNAHEEAQARWAALVNLSGGDARFTTGKGSL